MNAAVPMTAGPTQQFGPQYNNPYANHYGPVGSQKVSSPSSGVLSPMSMRPGPGPAMTMGPASSMGPAPTHPANQPGDLHLPADMIPMMGGGGGPGAMMTAGQGQMMTGPGPGQLKRGHMMMKGNMYGGLHQRMVPYPNPQQYMLTKRAQFPNGQEEVRWIVHIF